MGYATPTPIQSGAIPLVLAGNDVVGCAQTGTGKTAAFVLPTLQNIIAKPGGPRALVVTPGRLLDLIGQGDVDLSHVEVLILDEADRMLDQGFWPDVRRIIERCPTDRQTLLFSATNSPDVLKIIGATLKHPERIDVA